MFSKTKYIDICQYHNQTYDFLQSIKKKEDYFPKILINFDLHSDVKCNKVLKRISVSNWVNWAINEYNIDEYYWVIPKSILNNSQMLEHCFEKIKYTAKRACFYGNFTNNNYKYSPIECLKQTFILDKETSNIIAEYAYLQEKDINKIVNENKNYRLLNVYICTEDNLPDFNNKDIILSIDGDYFTNNGYDTFFDYKYDTDNINLLFENFIQCLEIKHINPIYLSFTISRNYSLHHEELINFYNTLYEKCKNKQTIDIKYVHTDLTDDLYTRFSIDLEKLNGQFIKILADNKLEADNQIKEYINDKYKSIEDGCYNLLLYVKEINNNNQTELLIYPFEQSLVKLQCDSIDT